MGRDHRGYQLAIALAAALCVALLIAATVVELRPAEDAFPGAGASDTSMQGQRGEKFLESGSDGEDLLDSAFDLVGLDNEGPARSWEAASLEEGASQLLDEYSQDSACVLAQSGYLDLQGHVWACVVTGGGWADICIVKQADSGEAAQVYCWRIDQGSVAWGLSK